MTKPLRIFWSLAAVAACVDTLDDTQSSVLQGVGELAARMDGWFFHTFKTSNGHILRCDANIELDCWRVHVRLAELTGDTPKYPEPVSTKDNQQFAEFWEIRKNLPDR